MRMGPRATWLPPVRIALTGQSAVRPRDVISPLITLGLTGEYGVFVTRTHSGWLGVYLGRHDGGQIGPTACVLAAAERIGYIR